jgi:hypothetical protein
MLKPNPDKPERITTKTPKIKEICPSRAPLRKLPFESLRV